MIPAKFDYVRPSTVEEAIAALQQGGEDAKILAGGQSLIPVLRLRLAAPSVLIDLGAISALRGIREDGDRIAIGAMTPYADIVRDELVTRPRRCRPGSPPSTSCRPSPGGDGRGGVGPLRSPVLPRTPLLRSVAAGRQ